MTQPLKFVATSLDFVLACRSSRVCKSWNQSITDELEQRFTKESTQGALAEAQKSIQIAPNGVFPPTITNLKDLKKRFSEILRFSPDIGIVLNGNFALLALVVRCTNLAQIKGRMWMACYTVHTPIMYQFCKSTKELAENQKIGLVLEGLSLTSAPIPGYLMGTDDVPVSLLSVALQGEKLLKQWEKFSANPLLKTQNPQEYNLLRQLLENIDLPFSLLMDQAKKDVESMLDSDSLQQWNDFFADPANKLFIDSFYAFRKAGKLNPDLYRQIRFEFIQDRAVEIRKIVKLVEQNCRKWLVSHQLLSQEAIAALEKHDTPLEQANESLSKDVMEEIFLKPRNKHMALGAARLIQHIPQATPAVLVAGGLHINPVLELMNADSKPLEAKENLT